MTNTVPLSLGDTICVSETCANHAVWQGWSGTVIALELDAEGAFVTAGGERRGRFNVNDVKVIDRGGGVEAAALADMSDIRLPVNAETYWAEAIGGAYRPRIWGKHRAANAASVAQAIRIGLQRAPECADVIAALVHFDLLARDREAAAWQMLDEANARLARLEQVSAGHDVAEVE